MDINKHGKKRAAGVVLKGDEVLLIRRVKDKEEYFVFPGGGVEEGETVEEALLREIKEELSVDAEIDRFLFKVYNPGRTDLGWIGRDDYFYLITEYSGEPILGGPEKERMNEDNQYYLEWHKIGQLSNMETLYPEHEKTKVIESLASI